MPTGPVPAVGPPPTSNLESLPATRRSILLALKKRGSAHAEELPSDLGVTVSALRQQLSSLQSDNLVAYEEVREGLGRPKHSYFLTPQADELFPRAYTEIATELFAYIEEQDRELLDRAFRRRRDRRIRQANLRLAGKSFEEKVRELTAILDDDGYVASCEQLEDGSYLIVEHNCAILGIASRYRQACSSEIEFIRSLLPEAEVTRLTHIVEGSRQCGYLVAPRAKRAPAWA
jgi:DeoR family suf operon transcriptional repressor